MKVPAFAGFGETTSMQPIVVGKTLLEVALGRRLSAGEQPFESKIFVKIGRVDCFGRLGEKTPVDGLVFHRLHNLNGRSAFTTGRLNPYSERFR